MNKPQKENSGGIATQGAAKMNIALIGAGPSTLYWLHHLALSVDKFVGLVGSITIYERGSELGAGMPYSREMCEVLHLSNIPSEEIPSLGVSLADWLRSLSSRERGEIGVSEPVDDHSIYPRIALGAYFQSRFRAALDRLREAGIVTRQFSGLNVTNVRYLEASGLVEISSRKRGAESYQFVVLSTGHRWLGEDRPSEGYFASPWPIWKTLPKADQPYNFKVGVLGASLSAFDLVFSLAAKHGKFEKLDGVVSFARSDDAPEFELVMHAINGELPQLRFALQSPESRIYEHVSRGSLAAMRECSGLLRLNTYFNRVCRTAFRDAFEKDGREDIVHLLWDRSFQWTDLIRELVRERRTNDPFGLMQAELNEARRSVETGAPTHWKETFDSLVYTLNFHAHWLPAEDHRVLREEIMPYTMTMIAALPIESAERILALRAAGVLSLVGGECVVNKEAGGSGETVVEVCADEEAKIERFRLFVDCTGRQASSLEEHPFRGLVEARVLRPASARFAGEAEGAKAGDLVSIDGESRLQLEGIDFTEEFQPVMGNGEVCRNLFDLASPDISGLRPYAYGLQGANDVARLAVAGLVENFCEEGKETA